MKIEKILIVASVGIAVYLGMSTPARGQVYGNATVRGVDPGSQSAPRGSNTLGGFTAYSTGSDSLRSYHLTSTNPLSGGGLPFGRMGGHNGSAGLAQRLSVQPLGGKIDQPLQTPNMMTFFNNLGAQIPAGGFSTRAGITPGVNWDFYDEDMAIAARPNPFFRTLTESPYSFRSSTVFSSNTRPMFEPIRSNSQSFFNMSPLRTFSLDGGLSSSTPLKDRNTLVGAFGSTNSIFGGTRFQNQRRVPYTYRSFTSSTNSGLPLR
jgi:hypothetical protein